MRLNEPPATLVALEEIIAVRGSCTESELDALEWAKDFMNNYEKRKNVTSTEIESEKCGRYSKREAISNEGSSVVVIPPKDSPESNTSFTN